MKEHKINKIDAISQFHLPNLSFTTKGLYKVKALAALQS